MVLYMLDDLPISNHSAIPNLAVSILGIDDQKSLQMNSGCIIFQINSQR